MMCIIRDVWENKESVLGREIVGIWICTVNTKRYLNRTPNTIETITGTSSILNNDHSIKKTCKSYPWLTGAVSDSRSE